MKKLKFNTSLFIFRRDLRLYDNKGLSAALKNSKTVIPCYFLENQYLDKNKKLFYRPNSLQFMFESLINLDIDLGSFGSRLNIFKGDLYKNFESFIGSMKIDAVFLNEDYSLYSQKRDKKLEKLCGDKKIYFYSFTDLILFKPGSVLNSNKKPYKVFSYFYKKILKEEVERPTTKIENNFYNKNLKNTFDISKIRDLIVRNNFIEQKGGRNEAISTLENISLFKNYSKERNFPFLDKTTKLSAHLKFGTISSREFYWKIIDTLGIEHSLVTALIWREFYYHLGFAFPNVFYEPFIKKYKSLKWENDKMKFKAWCEGKTGFPIVDAGMRQLNKTGWMHNRVRMIVASFLVKDLHIDWRWGEQYFRQRLVDYDVFSNNGGWQWSASTGADSQPYFRIFNPWKQQRRFDPDSIYIKKWIPELKKYSSKEINNIFDKNVDNYPSPIVDHKVETEKTKEYFKKLSV
ncbi:MAG: deoxyribodipyrimidine photo-lyase [Candidatus Dadabacteria bacterium]|nr:deoxyribodipyrimidine photo-lyase [Candidatus Dadabacteria bacterium]NIQ16454.1 deoxyribodipyrimidine photo-lyase [Candidatus Dadabacteria bacterium]